MQHQVEILGTAKEGSLLYRYALPSIIGMVASSLYNLVDSVFIGHEVGVLAIAALSIALPLMNLSSAFGSLIGIGSSALLSLKLGEKDGKSASLCAANVVILTTIISIAYTLISLIFLDPILLFFGASEDTLPLARDYMRIILAGTLFTQIFLSLNEVIRSSGYPQKAMILTIMVVTLNALLDVLFIFGFGWGIKGAAYATVLAQVTALFFVLKHLIDKNSAIHFSWENFRPNKSISFKLLTLGLSPFLINVCTSLVVIIYNNTFKQYGGDIYSRIRHR